MQFLPFPSITVPIAACVLSRFPQPPVPDLGEECDTLVSGSTLVCYNACTQNCVATAVNTNKGHSGYICSCDIVGPPYVCCKTAYAPGQTPDHELVGRCSVAGCNSGTCKELAAVVGGEIVGWVGRCMQPAPGGGG